jgi:spermidine synthase
VQRNTLFIFVFPLLSFLGHFLSIYWALMHLLNFFMLALLCHGELVQRRPLPAHLTTFYFCLALGGALAGIFNGLLAPTLFVSAYEYPLMLVLALFFLPIEIKKRDWVVLPLLFLWLLLSVWLPNQGIGHWIKSYYLMESVAIGALLIWPQSRRTLVLGVLMMLTFWLGPWFQPQSTIYQKRNFYGIKKVMAAHHTHTLMSQNTLHGFQVMDNAASLQGTLSYYGPVKPVVHAMQTIPQPLRVVIVGLGTGTLACQFHPIDRVTMIEVDKQVIALATNPQLFTYLRDCPVAELIEADGRLAIQQALDGAYDLLIMDAFSSDAIPSHLLTQEAFNLYRKKLSAQGVMLIHVSNRYVDLLPVLTTIGQSLEWIVLRKQEAPHPTLGQLPSEWVLLTPNESLAQQLMSQEHWRFVSDVGGLLWTDDYTPILPLLR